MDGIRVNAASQRAIAEEILNDKPYLYNLKVKRAITPSINDYELKAKLVLRLHQGVEKYIPHICMYVGTGSQWD